METDKEKLKLLLQDTAEGRKFWCIDGKIFGNLKELKNALSKISDETFNYHVNSEKNDFVEWINKVIGDIKLAKSLENVFDKKTTERKIRARITYINKIINKSSV